MYAYEHVRCRVLVDECINRIGNFLFIWYFFLFVSMRPWRSLSSFSPFSRSILDFTQFFLLILFFLWIFQFMEFFFPFCTKLGIQINLFRKWTNTMWGVVREWNFCEEFFIFSAVLARLVDFSRVSAKFLHFCYTKKFTDFQFFFSVLHSKSMRWKSLN